MTAYNDANVTYNSLGPLYNGLELGTPLTLIVNGADVTHELAYGSLSVRTATHGNSLGTLDAKLNDPSAAPTVDQGVDLYIETDRRYRGTVKATSTTEYRGGHTFTSFSAQDSGPDGSLPTAAPFGVSDTPDGVTTHGYESLRVATRTTEGGAAKTTAELIVNEDGLWSGQNIDVTSANHGLSAQEFTIVEVQARWGNPGAPEYTLQLGEPLVRMSDLVLDGDIVPDGSITTTKISDGAISTPKLAANAVTADKIEAESIETSHFSTTAEAPEVRNSTGEVVIEPAGITVTNGKITVTNPSATVVIDGTSNMFKIAATGTQSVTVNADSSNSVSVTLTGLGSLPTTPAHISFIANGNSTSASQHLGVFFTQVNAKWASSTNGGVTNQDVVIPDQLAEAHTALNGSSQAVATLAGWNRTGSAVTYYHRYYVLQEAAL